MADAAASVAEDIEAHTEEDTLAEDIPAVVDNLAAVDSLVEGSLAADIPAAEGSLVADIPAEEDEDILAVDKHLLNIPPADNLIIRSHQKLSTEMIRSKRNIRME